MNREEIETSRRIQRITLNGETLAQVLSGDRKIVFSNPVVILDIRELRTYQKSAFAIFIGSEDFEPVDQALEVPETLAWTLVQTWEKDDADTSGETEGRTVLSATETGH